MTEYVVTISRKDEFGRVVEQTGVKGETFHQDPWEAAQAFLSEKYLCYTMTENASNQSMEIVTPCEYLTFKMI